MTISPSLLSADFLNLESELKVFDNQKALWFHLDIMDGHFVPNMTFGIPIIKQIGKVAKHPLDAHLMVTNPLFYVESLKDFNIHNLTFHFEATKHHDSLINKIKKHYPSVGMALNPGTSVDLIPDYILEMLDLILIMSVNPGFGGQKFIPYALLKVEELNRKRVQRQSNDKFKYVIQVDGGINQEEAHLLTQKGANNLVAGSYVFDKKTSANYSDYVDYNERVDSLRRK
ncbi:MAG: ribulose-phosphate 3-epimerase [Oligoflexia bacterium]|nr:ribulose-phosphate 3-epimerase [Oligoflexia bacterium]